MRGLPPAEPAIEAYLALSPSASSDPAHPAGRFSTSCATA